MTTDLAMLAARRRVIEQTIPLLEAIRSVAEMAFRRAQDRLSSVVAYGDELSAVLGELVTSLEPGERESYFRGLLGTGPTALVVICSERGLCGPFNSRPVRRALDIVDEHLREHTTPVQLLCWGSKGSRLLDAAGITPLYTAALGSFALPVYLDVERQALDLLELVEKRNFSEVQVVHNVPVHGFQYQTVVSQLLPPDLQWSASRASRVEIKPAGDLPALATHLMTEYTLAWLYRAMVESATSEQLARVAAMNMARDNASRLLDRLTLDYQVARRGSITASLLELVTGYGVATADH